MQGVSWLFFVLCCSCNMFLRLALSSADQHLLNCRVLLQCLWSLLFASVSCLIGRLMFALVFVFVFDCMFARAFVVFCDAVLTSVAGIACLFVDVACLLLLLLLLLFLLL
ncbi:unnamed protein product [Polarella glacialis]|uniref:Uncharacterized protein n=1 Tax=Polarella glacialis TaxID=89957 RepID=A0A813J899_POLGL|nr:unnamed protein product [Polarella glacialis]